MLSLCAEVLTSKVSSRRCKNAKGLVSGLQSALPGRKVGMAEMEYAGGLSPRLQSRSVRLPTKVICPQQRETHVMGGKAGAGGKEALPTIPPKNLCDFPARSCAENTGR